MHLLQRFNEPWRLSRKVRLIRLAATEEDYWARHVRDRAIEDAARHYCICWRTYSSQKKKLEVVCDALAERLGAGADYGGELDKHRVVVGHRSPELATAMTAIAHLALRTQWPSGSVLTHPQPRQAPCATQAMMRTADSKGRTGIARSPPPPLVVFSSTLLAKTPYKTDSAAHVVERKPPPHR
ncbi:unspecified product [Leishmania tarentolae]|uniref:Unspecified product n=1 Tax=Leishmania tarentolae TaxID=5689 RepID=A0A640KAC4_LEITA|nr:unspecified product [Leishmania tarentolae]